MKPAVWSSDWDIYLGTYRRRSGDTAVLRQENDLVVLSPLSEDPSGSQGVLKPTTRPTSSGWKATATALTGNSCGSR